MLLLLLISSFNTIRTGQLCRNSIVDEFDLQDIKLMLYWCEGPYDRSIFSSLYLGLLGIGFLWVWEESRPLVKCNGSDHWRTSFTKSCSRLRNWDGSMWFLMKQYVCHCWMGSVRNRWFYQLKHILISSITEMVELKEYEWMNENARILSAFENRLRVGFV